MDAVAIDTNRYTDSLDGTMSERYAEALRKNIASGALAISDAVDAAYGDETEDRLTEFANDICDSKEPAKVKSEFITATVDRLVEIYEETGNDIS